MLFFASIWLLQYNKEKTGFGLEMYNNSYGILPVTCLCAFFGIFVTVIVANRIRFPWLIYIGENSLVFFLLHQAMVYPLLDVIYQRIGWGNAYGTPLRFFGICFSKILITCLVLYGVNELFINTRLRVFLGKK